MGRPKERTVKAVEEAVYRPVLRRRESPAQAERREILESMAETRRLLSQAYQGFNAYSDPDLVDACVYEINALQSRYSYFVRQVKLLDAAREGAV